MLIRTTSWLAVLLLAGLCLAVTPLAAAEHAAGGGHPSAEAEEPLNPNPLNFKADLAVWTAVVFLAVLLVLWRFAWGPIADGLQKRETRIAEDIAAAQRTHEEARQLLASYEQKLASAEDEVRQIFEKARRDASEAGRQLVEKARADAEAEQSRAVAEIERATAASLKELAERSATLAVELAGKIVGSKLDPRAHNQLIQQAVERFSQTRPNGH